MSNYPIGAENDPDAPWNTDVFFCMDCETHEIKDYIDKHIDTLVNTQELGGLSDYEHDTLHDRIYDDLVKEKIIGICRNCHFDNEID